jgi:hypothetical protein
VPNDKEVPPTLAERRDLVNHEPVFCGGEKTTEEAEISNQPK